MKRLLLILFAFILPAWAAFHTENMTSQKLRVTTDSQFKSSSILHFVVACSQFVDKSLNCSSLPDKLIFIYENETNKHKDLEFQFTATTDILEFTAGVMKLLLIRRGAELAQNKNYSFSPDFLAAAFAYLFIMQDGGFTDFNYKPARHQFNRRFFPDAIGLVSSPMIPDSPWLFRLYALHSAILLDCLLTLPENFPRKMLSLQAQQLSQENAFFEAVKGQIKNETSIQNWYQSLATRLVRRQFAGSTADIIAQKVNELDSILVVEAGNPIADLVRVKIDENPDAIAQLLQDKAALYARQNDFLKLRNEAPLLLRKPLEQFAHSLGWLASGEVRKFKSDIKTARNTLNKELQRYQALERRLDAIERENSSPVRLFQAEMEIFRLFQKRIDAMPLPIALPQP